jgi:DNA helicase-2/ATP-dependent DNA helicase PcrA
MPRSRTIGGGIPKNLQAARSSAGSLPALIPARDADQQAAFVAARILEIAGRRDTVAGDGGPYRAHYHALELQLELTRRGIPYEVRSGVRFFEQAHIKDLVAYLRLLVNPRDEPGVEAGAEADSKGRAGDSEPDLGAAGRG